MGTPTDLIERLTFDTQTLITRHAPYWRHPNKRVIAALACPEGAVHGGELEYSLWCPKPLPPDAIPSIARVIGRPGFYDYVPSYASPDAVEWHVNFADRNLFFGYGSGWLAQDEIQVAEHPALAALREALVDRGPARVPIGILAVPPVLVMGVERRCRVDTAGIYGNAFARASAEAIRHATTVIDPPTITNLIALVAPSGGHGRYSRDQIEAILVTAYTGFRAAMLESERRRGGPCLVVVHSGYWGCGAFGGNRVLMAAAQVVAARMAGVDRLVFHTGAAGGGEPLKIALECVREWGQGSGRELIERIDGHGFQWGRSDGN